MGVIDKKSSDSKDASPNPELLNGASVYRRDSLNQNSSPGFAKQVSIMSGASTSTLVSTAEDQKGEIKSIVRKSKLRRCRKRLSTLLHTHVALILVCSLAALDSACVIGQIICDILIMKEDLHEWEKLDENLTDLLWKKLPALNVTNHDPNSLNLRKIQQILLKDGNQSHDRFMQMGSSGVALHDAGLDRELVAAIEYAAHNGLVTSDAQSNVSHLNLQSNASNLDFDKTPVDLHKMSQSLSRRKRQAEDGEGKEHTLLHELTHAFHLGSMIILSILLLETILKIFAMGKKVLHHKLEMFDAFVVSVSWILDIAFLDGIWEQPGTEAATILIFILPWRVVRIVNSFVLVIQEKEHVQLKIVKQRLRLSMKKSKESTRKASCYRVEVKQLQGLCRKYGASENEINACGPTARNGRRRSSLVPVMEHIASLTLISAIGSHPSLFTMDSSTDEEEEEDSSRGVTRTASYDPTLRSAYSTTTLDSATSGIFTVEGKNRCRIRVGSEAFVTSDNENSGDGLDNPVFEDTPPDSPSAPSEHSEVTEEREETRSHHHHHHRRLHQLLQEQPSLASVESTSTTCSEVGNQELPPTYHEVVSKQDSITRL